MRAVKLFVPTEETIVASDEVLGVNEIVIDLDGTGIYRGNGSSPLTSLAPVLTPGEGGASSSSTLPHVANYAALPAPSAHTGESYAVLASQGTAWLPGSLGGTYYSKGIYYSDGATWSFLGSAPSQATQSEVNIGTADTVFVAPNTLASWWIDRKAEQAVIDKVNISGSTTIAPTRESFYLIDTSGASFTVFLPTAVGKTGLKVHLCKTSASNTLTIDANSSETINGSLTAPIYKQNEVLTIVSDGSNWRVI